MSDPHVRSRTDDAALLTAIQRGDEDALAQLYDRYAATVLAVTLGILQERSDAEAAVLEAFTQAWRTAGRYEAGRGSVLNWLITIARSRSIDMVRAAGRRARVVSVSVDDAPPAALAADEHTVSPSHAAEASEQRDAVAAALLALPASQRRVIELAFFDGLTHSEIAERLAEPLGTVKTRIRLGMTKLRDLLRPHREEVAT